MNSKRKVAVLVGDGMGDYGVEELGTRSPLQAAHMPWTRKAAARGSVYLVRTVPDGMAPGSDVANLGLLGYNAAQNYTGRAAIEAAGAGIKLTPDDVAYRTNLVTVSDGIMEDYSAGDISSEEGHALIRSLNEAAAKEGLKFYGGVSYRHLLILNDGPTNVTLWPPHEISGRETADYLPSGERADDLRALMELSKKVFHNHPVNIERRKQGQREATQIWLWGHGKSMSLKPYVDLYQRRGGMISAVDLLRGLAVLAGLDVIVVPGATGWIDTNYSGKAQAAIDCLAEQDFVYVHVEAPDECGHKGEALLKKEAIENFDRLVVGPVWQALEKAGAPYRVIICTDHRTPVSFRGHSAEPVPFAWVDGPIGTDPALLTTETPFDEFIPEAGTPPLVCDVINQLLS